MLRDILAGIICGLEHSGTTITLRLLQIHPSINSGTELGILTHKDPKNAFDGKYKVYKKYFRSWGHTESSVMEIIKNVKTLEEFYTKLRDNSKREDIKSSPRIVDKTPGYIYKLNRHIMNVTEDVPVVITVKDPVNMFHSFNKRGINYKKFEQSYKCNYLDKINYVLENYSDRILICQHENLFEDPKREMKKILNHLGEEFDEGVYSDKTLSLKIVKSTDGYDKLSEKMINRIKSDIKCDFYVNNASVEGQI